MLYKTESILKTSHLKPNVRAVGFPQQQLNTFYRKGSQLRNHKRLQLGRMHLCAHKGQVPGAAVRCSCSGV